MSLSFLAALVFCTLFLLIFGAMIYFYNHTKPNPPSLRSYRYGMPKDPANWRGVFLRGSGNVRKNVEAEEAFEDLMTTGRRRRLRERKRRRHA